MRPVVRPHVPADLIERAHPVALLIQASGAYCSLCERPLPAAGWSWHPDLGGSLVDRLDAGAWMGALLLDHNCAASQFGKPERDLLLPTTELTFLPNADSPYRYVRESCRVLFEDPSGKVVFEDKRDFVFVRGTTQGAEAVIRRFELNSPYFVPDGALRVTAFDRLSRRDVRIVERTQCWDDALRLAEHIRRAESREVLAAVIELGRASVASAGFWSTWATVLWEELHDVELLEQILLPRPDAAFERGPGLHNPFPGTRREWLRYARR